MKECGARELVLGRRARLARAVSRFLIAHPFKGANRLRRRLAELLVPQPWGPMACPTAIGFTVLIDPSVDRGVERELYYHGIYEAGTLDVMASLLRPGDTFVDIGANVGLMTLAASRAVGDHGRVHAFEPVPSTFGIMRANVALNAATNVSLHQLALGSQRERGTIYERMDVNRGRASMVEEGPGSAVHTVDVDTLDHFVRTHDVGPIRIVKIDVEGWELEVLKGAKAVLSRSDAPIVIAEYSEALLASTGADASALDFLTTVNDYVVFKLRFGKESLSRLREVRHVSELPRHDNLFCFRRCHLTHGHGTLFRHAPA